MGLFSDAAACGPQLARIERKLDALIQHLNIQLPADSMDDIRDMIALGRKVAAVKEYRARTGASLFEAKQAVDAMIPGVRSR